MACLTAVGQKEIQESSYLLVVMVLSVFGMLFVLKSQNHWQYSLGILPKSMELLGISCTSPRLRLLHGIIRFVYGTLRVLSLFVP